MKTVTQWMHEYAQSHTNPVNQIIHKICVPLITYSLLGMLWVIPLPSPHPLVNPATVFFAACLIFYFRLSLAMALGMMVQALVMLTVCWQVAQISSQTLLISSVVIFSVAWVFQFIGHHIEGKRPSFLKDLQFLLIGPLWVLYPIYRKLGISLQ